MKTILLLIFLLVNLLATTQQELITIYKKNFKNSDLFGVREIDNKYFILSSTIKFNKKDETNRLILLAKAILFQYIKKHDIKTKSLELKGLKTIFVKNKNNREYLLCFIKKDNVQAIYTSTKNIKTISIIDNEIKALKKREDNNITIHKQLKELYFLKGDIKNYSKETDYIIEFEFNNF